MGCGASTEEKTTSPEQQKQLAPIGTVVVDPDTNNAQQQDDDNEKSIRETENDHPQTEPKEDDVVLDDLTETHGKSNKEEEQPRPNSTSQLSLNSNGNNNDNNTNERKPSFATNNNNASIRTEGEDDDEDEDELQDDDVIVESPSSFDIEDDAAENSLRKNNRPTRHSSGMFGPRGPSMRKGGAGSHLHNTNSSSPNNNSISGGSSTTGGGNKQLGRMGVRPNAGSNMKNAIKIAGARGANFGGMAAAGQRR